jgi:hypothetical protein
MESNDLTTAIDSELERRRQFVEISHSLGIKRIVQACDCETFIIGLTKDGPQCSICETPYTLENIEPDDLREI